jgi:histidinol-phosphate aminotransferase
MAAAVTPATRLVFLANPNNPTGTWVTREHLTAFLDGLPQHVLVVLDEAYFEYLTHPDYPDGVALLPRHPNLVVTRTFSKVHGLAPARHCRVASAIADVLNRSGNRSMSRRRPRVRRTCRRSVRAVSASRRAWPS